MLSAVPLAKCVAQSLYKLSTMAEWRSEQTKHAQFVIKTYNNDSTDASRRID